MTPSAVPGSLPALIGCRILDEIEKIGVAAPPLPDRAVRRQEKTKSSAVTGTPSDHSASRRLKVQVRPSGEVFQCVAMPGMGRHAGSSVIRPTIRSPMISVVLRAGGQARGPGSRAPRALPRSSVCGIGDLMVHAAGWPGAAPALRRPPPAPRRRPEPAAGSMSCPMPSRPSTMRPGEHLPGLRQTVQWLCVGDAMRKVILAAWWRAGRWRPAWPGGCARGCGRRPDALRRPDRRPPMAGLLLRRGAADARLAGPVAGAAVPAQAAAGPAPGVGAARHRQPCRGAHRPAADAQAFRPFRCVRRRRCRQQLADPVL